MFGYTIKLVKKRDIVEQEEFERVTVALNTELNEFMTWLRNAFVADGDSIKQLTINIEGLHSMIDVYSHNKYSTPSGVINMNSRISEIRKYASNIATYVERIIDMHDLMSGVPTSYDKFDEMLKEYKLAMTITERDLTKDISMIYSALQFIQLSIENDVIQIMMGVDIGELYRSRKKCLKKQGDLVNRFTIDFGIQTKSDDQFIHKEETKDE